MKILFICNKIDKQLRQRITQLEANGAQTAILSLTEYKLTTIDKEVIDLDPQSPLEFLEDNLSSLRILNRTHKRKKIINDLEYYDLIDIYKNEKTALLLIDNIMDKCYGYFVTVSDEEEEIGAIAKYKLKQLYKKAIFIIFSSQIQQENFPFKFSDKSEVVRNGIEIFEEIDKIDEQKIMNFANRFDIDRHKNVVYCELLDSIQNQKELIEEIVNLQKERLKQHTFIFTLLSHSVDERKDIKEFLSNKKFDFLLLDSMLTPPQRAMLLKVSNSAIVLSTDPKYDTLQAVLYAKNLTYLYRVDALEPVYAHNDIFIERFSHFIDPSQSSYKIELIDDMLEQNAKKVYEIFAPQNAITNYIEAIKRI